jgi:P-type Cu+ transporter
MEKTSQKALPGAGVIYTCPMHPQIRHKGPGNCPICGMTLEPLVATVEEGPNVELRDMSRRFWVGLVLTVPVLFLEMGSHVPALGLHPLVVPRTSSWVQFVLSTPVVRWAGWPFFQRGWASIVDCIIANALRLRSLSFST